MGLLFELRVSTLWCFTVLALNTIGCYCHGASRSRVVSSCRQSFIQRYLESEVCMVRWAVGLLQVLSLTCLGKLTTISGGCLVERPAASFSSTHLCRVALLGSGAQRPPAFGVLRRENVRFFQKPSPNSISVFRYPLLIVLILTSLSKTIPATWSRGAASRSQGPQAHLDFVIMLESLVCWGTLGLTSWVSG